MADTTTTPVTTEPETEVVQPRSRRRGIIVIVIAVIAVAALAFWWHSTFYEDTDDAQISGHLIQVSARIQGQVLHVDVEENQQVKKGDLIAELDPRDYQVAVENAQAALASAQANAAAANVAVPLTTINTGSNLTSATAQLTGARASVQQAQGQLQAAQARVAQAEANNAKAQSDLHRYKPLVDKDVISKQQWDGAAAAYSKAYGLDPKGAGSNDALAAASYSQGKALEAKGLDGGPDFRRAIELKPDYAPAKTAAREEAGPRPAWMLYVAGGAAGLALVLFAAGMVRRRA